MQRFLLPLALCAFLCAEEKSTTPGKEENWLQKNIQEQQKLQENRTASDADKKNPFKAIEKPNPEKPKSTEPFTLIRNKETTETKAPTKVETPRPINNDITFKPAISGMLSDSFNKQQSEKQSRNVIEKMESTNKDSDSQNTNEEDSLDKIRKERAQKNINSRADDKLFDNKFDLPGNFDHPNTEVNRKNPYLSENQNRASQNRDPLITNPLNTLPTVQMIKPIETPQMIQNPALNRSVFENQNPQNQSQIYNQMLNTPGSNKSRVKDPNDFLRR